MIKSCIHGHMHPGTIRLWFQKHNLKDQSGNGDQRPSKQTMAPAQTNVKVFMYSLKSFELLTK